MKRIVVQELLDSDSGTVAEVEDSLTDLNMLNRWFGGVRVTTTLLRRVAEKRQLETASLLDVAGASGYVLTQARESLHKIGIALAPAVLDRVPTHLGGSLPSVCGDALAMPFADDSFDVVTCSLFVHHLEPPEIVQFANEALRVARHAVIINDLIRHPLHWATAVAGRLIYRSRLTRFDAPASVRRAYTTQEMRDLLEKTNAARHEISTSYFFRMGVIVWKPQQ
ncbi:MAG TPA: methyltransferase domain-containing protein [Candidatus Angelobacter sp.]|nr:methyltransferase domain-containing protein [Candidatus Angelobacter sp.]